MLCPGWVKVGQTSGLGKVGQLGQFPKTCFLAISDHSELFSKFGLGWFKVGHFSNPNFLPFQTILSIFQKIGFE